ncbi:MFS transporter [Romboutsia sedimentorum]|uniref:MFS transporter n=1 Tax=Romboutsia sedimentorum TaxID=1368474 RepID=UPI0024DF04D3|nr:MFS transporter [Romboutsia sedimentorum]MDK2584551.1 MFS transporter [Romboutsia sedimentorum]
MIRGCIFFTYILLTRKQNKGKMIILPRKEKRKDKIIMQRKMIYSKDFSLMAIGQIISLFGNQILRYALPLYLLNQTGSSALFGTISACAFIPMLIMFPIGGIIADRVNKRNIMVILDFSTAVLILIFYMLVGISNIVPLMAATMIILYGIQGAYQPAVKASIPVLVDTKHIMQANSVVDVISSLASMVGPVIGGILFSIVGLEPILYVSIICFFISAVMEIFINIPFEQKQVKGNIFIIGFSDIKESFAFVFKKQPVLWKMSLYYASVNLFLTSLILIGVPVLITQHLGFSPNVANRLYGYAQGIIAAGSVLGGVLAATLSKKLKPSSIPFFIIAGSISIILEGIALQTLGNSMAIYIILVIGCCLLLTLVTLFTIQIMSYLQILTPKDLIGKVISCVMCICMCTNPIGQLIYGIVFEKVGSSIYIPFYVAAMIMIGISIFSRHIFYGISDAAKC